MEDKIMTDILCLVVTVVLAWWGINNDLKVEEEMKKRDGKR